MRKEKLVLYGGVFWAFWSLAVWCFSSPRDSLYLDQSEQFATTGATECPEVKFKYKNYCQTGSLLQKCAPEQPGPGDTPPCSGSSWGDCTLKLGTDTGDTEPAVRATIGGLVYNCGDQGSSSVRYSCVKDENNKCVPGEITGAGPCIGTRTIKLNKAC
jgi:hypothetical protein